jgi:NAD(P)-dependent dehydrogenase (short-subunit alcohol dehydrogenase family)
MSKEYYLLFIKLYQFLLMVDQSLSMDLFALLNKDSPELSVCSATKAAVLSFARCWTVDLKERHIRVNTLSPGPTDTPMFWSALDRETVAVRIKVETMMGRLGTPDEIAKAAVFLTSDDSSYITGIELCADGGVAQV